MTIEAPQPSPEQLKKTPALPESVSNEQVRARYIERDGELRQEDAELLQALVEGKGFTISFSTEKPDRVESLNWHTKDQDFAAFDKLIENLLTSAEEKDELYAQSRILEVFTTLLNGSGTVPASPLFQRLHDPTIPTSPAHRGTTPMEHTRNVSFQLNTEKIDNPQERVIARFYAWTHDLGKLVIADQDFYQLHGEISFLILKEYFRTRPALLGTLLGVEKVTEQTIQDFLGPIRYHHGMELIQRSILDGTEVTDLLKSKEQTADITEAYTVLLTALYLRLWGTLVIADAGSVEKYREFSVLNVAHLIEIHRQKSEGMINEEELLTIRNYILQACKRAELIPSLSQSILLQVGRILDQVIGFFQSDEELLEVISRSQFFSVRLNDQFLGTEQSS